MTVVAVVIPYFQRRPGILRRALTSLLQQNLPPDTARVDILLVDDGSPVPARSEITDLDISAPFQLRLIEQPNNGVAGARNTALRLVAADTTYIAFLDSDDIWKPTHLATALAALDRGYDLYFCDCRRVGDRQSRFEEHPLFQSFLRGHHAHIIGDRLFELEQLPFFSQSLRAPPYRTSDVVYRRDAAPALAFDTALREVGEDSIFQLQLISQSKKICCSTQELMTLADGVNIWDSKFTWDNPGHLFRHIGMIQYHLRVLSNFRLSYDDAAFIAGRVRTYHRVFAFLALRYFIKKRALWPRDLVRLVCGDRSFWLWFPAWALYVAITYPLGLYDPIKHGDIYHAPPTT